MLLLAFYGIIMPASLTAPQSYTIPLGFYYKLHSNSAVCNHKWKIQRYIHVDVSSPMEHTEEHYIQQVYPFITGSTTCKILLVVYRNSETPVCYFHK